MRVFFALAPSPSTAIALADWRDRHAACDGRPVPPANFHLTLAFAGELPPARIEALCERVDDGFALPGQSLLLDTPGYWPHAGLFWLGPGSWPRTLDTLAGQLRRACSTQGARLDRNRFRPHVTLYRGCDAPPAAPTSPPAIEFSCDRLTLFESRQGRRGVSYLPLQEWDTTPGAHLPGGDFG